MLDKQGRFVIDNYATRSPFASFLPGISGKTGIPIWSFYVNRGQAICSFGVEDKAHSIMEFCPAHQSYQRTGTLGYRTFLRVDGEYYEPFHKDAAPKTMYTGMNELEIEEKSAKYGVQTNVLYYILPGEKLGGMVRRVTVKNTGSAPKKVEILDGLPALIPFGVTIFSMQSAGQTTKAWMQVEDVESALPYYRVRVSMSDEAEVKEVTGGYFYFTVDADGNRLPVIVDPEVAFEYDLALTEAVGMQKHSLSDLLAKKQVAQNNVPTGLFGKEVTLAPGEEVTLYGICGQADSKELLNALVAKCDGKNYFDKKYAEAVSLTDDLCRAIHTKTADKTFDAYCKQIHLDNILRGGYPIVLGKDKVFYIYSRKHGDIERDYNWFVMSPEFYSQGNANFRDVNQNRRSDVRFYPYTGDLNIKLFYDLIQLDGCNPLSIERMTFTADKAKIADITACVKGDEAQKKLAEFLEKPFSPGSLMKFVGQENIQLDRTPEAFLDVAADASVANMNAAFGEGYWCDHWTYNLDLVESFLAIYPDKEKQLLFDDHSYTYFESKALVLPRSKRYVKTGRGIRQYRSIDAETKKNVPFDRARVNYGKGDTFTTNLITKMAILALTKFTALDAYGMGIEMEGGKPGWYDALNGLPGIFGSSMCETYELARMLEFMIRELEKYGQAVEMPVEAVTLMNKATALLADYNAGKLDLFGYWDAVNTAKEAYRETITWGVDGKMETIAAADMLTVLKAWDTFTQAGIARAIEYGKGICPSYFSYEMSDYTENGEEITARKFDVVPLPYFLEGPSRWLKLDAPIERKKDLYTRVRASGLFDKKLEMYKVNEDLSSASFELGRCKAFTPGWLENESVFLHMEYKYLLELLKSGLYEEFFKDIRTMFIPFLDEKVYGRSLLENCSFLASSANPNEHIHGQGFVARLSGSTAEFVNMWQLMFIGSNPFTVEDGKLALTLTPVVPDYLIGADKTVECTLLGNIAVTYTLNKQAALIPGSYTVTGMDVTFADGTTKSVTGGKLVGADAEAVRDGKVTALKVAISL